LIFWAAVPCQAAEVKLKWTWPSFNASPDSCVDDSTKPLLDLYRGELWVTRIPEMERISLGFLPASGYAGRTDSCVTELADSIHYAVYELIAEDGYGNKACGGNQELVAVPARDWLPGLQATYFDNEDLTGQFARRIDSIISFAWGTGAAIPGMGADLFSERWEGQVFFPVSGVWTLSAIVEDGWRGWVNGVYVANDFGVQAVHESSCQFVANAGWNPILVEAMHHNGNAQMTLSFTPPGGVKQIVPASNWRH
jgi:PA14 domain